ncbi:MAG: N-acetylmuramoyl-L-alanine amidase [Anaerolineae bacterium]|nr:N-acetylmuramoyl-L-alanine amidase [Anaerolineae bacterium]
MSDEETQQPENSGEVPASVTFMELMRRAASQSQENDSPTDSSPSPATTPAEAPPAGQDPTPPPGTPMALLSEEDRARKLTYDTALEAERVRRVQRRRARRRRSAVSLVGGFVRTLIVVFAAAGLMATIFTWWTPSQFITSEVRSELSVAQATSQATVEPTGLPTPNWFRRIGIVSGHRGPEADPGAVCPDGLTEAEINFEVAQRVVRNLRGLGYSVDLLDEFDSRLDNYQAAALVSIHANTCQDWGEVVSGYLIAAAAARATTNAQDGLLVDCVARYYQQASGLQRRDGATVDMTDYHTFREISPLTPATIIELGFLLADRNLLTQQPDLLAQGITDGIVCFLNSDQSTAEVTQPPPQQGES